MGTRGLRSRAAATCVNVNVEVFTPLAHTFTCASYVLVFCTVCSSKALCDNQAAAAAFAEKIYTRFKLQLDQRLHTIGNVY